jgi:hypothetical protein
MKEAMIMDKSNAAFFEDLKDSLKWLFVGAVVWKASNGRQVCPNQDALGMFTSFVQARALYEFYCEARKDRDDDARAEDFCDSWATPKSALYARYKTPLNKRVFHPVYGRSQEQNAGASGSSGPGHLNQQVLEFANDLLRITERFVQCAKQEFKTHAQSALDDSYGDAQNAARHLGITVPF